MPKSTKLSELIVEEASGVDHPAHLHEGWVVMKSTELDEALDSLSGEETHTSTQGESQVELTQNENEVVETEEETVAVEEEVTSEEVAPEPTPVLASVEGPNHSAVEKELTDLRKELEDARKAHTSLVEEREMEKALSASHRWAILPELNPNEFAPVLRSLRAADADAAKKIEEIFDATSVALSEAGVLKELGTDASPAGEDAYSIIEAQAQELVNSGEFKTMAKAISSVAERQPELYSRYMTEKGF